MTTRRVLRKQLHQAQQRVHELELLNEQLEDELPDDADGIMECEVLAFFHDNPEVVDSIRVPEAVAVTMWRAGLIDSASCDRLTIGEFYEGILRRLPSARRPAA